jgi:hypothetical protein
MEDFIKVRALTSAAEFDEISINDLPKVVKLIAVLNISHIVSIEHHLKSDMFTISVTNGVCYYIDSDEYNRLVRHLNQNGLNL